MPTAIEFIADRLPRVTVKDVRRFADTVEIRDAKAFAAELQAFVHERVEAVKLPANLEGETVEQACAVHGVDTDDLLEQINALIRK